MKNGQTLSQMTPVHSQRAVAACNAPREALAPAGEREHRVGTSCDVGIAGEAPQRFPRGAYRARRIAGAEQRTR